jgi:tetratricopeptide (TPR) repeat protein
MQTNLTLTRPFPFKEELNSKRQKLRTTCNADALPTELVELILNKLPPTDLCAFGSTCHSYQQHSVKSWKKLKEEYGFNFEWRRGGENKAKNEFIMSLIISNFYLKYKVHLRARNASTASQFEEKYRDLEHSFPQLNLLFQAYINYHERSKVNWLIFSDAENAGEYLLTGLKLLADDGDLDLQLVKLYFTKAISQGASFASLIFNSFPDISFTLKLQLAVVAANHGDERALSDLVISNDMVALEVKQGGCYYSTELTLAFNLKFKEKQDEMIDAAIQLLKPISAALISPSISNYLLLAADYKRNVGKQQAADLLYDKYFTTSYPCSVESLLHAALTKAHLNKVDEAKSLVSKAFTVRNASCVLSKDNRFSPEEYEIVDEIFKIISSYGNNTLNDLSDYAFIKLQQQKFTEADQLFTKIFTLGFTAIPPTLFCHAARCKIQLGKFQEADHLFSQALPALQNRPEQLVEVAINKRRLNNFVEAEQLIDAALESSNGHASVAVSANAARIKMNLGKYVEADIHCRRALELTNSPQGFLNLFCATFDYLQYQKYNQYLLKLQEEILHRFRLTRVPPSNKS